MNATLVQEFAGDFTVYGLGVGKAFVIVLLLSVTLVVTAATIVLCIFVRAHYTSVARELRLVSDEIGPVIERMDDRPRPPKELDPELIGTEAVAEIERLCREVHLRYPRTVFFAGNLIFTKPTWWTRLLHNETAHSIQRRLEFDRLPMVILPVRVP